MIEQVPVPNRHLDRIGSTGEPIQFDSHESLRMGLPQAMLALGAQEVEITVVRKSEDVLPRQYKPDDANTPHIVVKYRGPREAADVRRTNENKFTGKLWPEPDFRQWFVERFTDPHIAFENAVFRVTAVRSPLSPAQPSESESRVKDARSSPTDHDVVAERMLEGVHHFDSLQDLLDDPRSLLRFFDSLPRHEKDAPYQADLRIEMQDATNPHVITLERPTRMASRILFTDPRDGLKKPVIVNNNWNQDFLYRINVHPGEVVTSCALQAHER